MSMSMPEFATKMNKFFGIKDSNNYLDTIMTSVSGKLTLDILKMDNWLHHKHGEYEEENKHSMSSFIKQEYGSAAVSFVRSVM